MPIKYHIPYELDSPERTEYHRKLLLSKPFLQKLFRDWYEIFIREIRFVPHGQVLEIGSGGGFLKEVMPTVTTSDILPLAHTDMTFSALNMPFDDAALSAILMIDTFHHIPDATQFLKEVDRTLVKGGKMVMIEPANSWWGRNIYQRFHHEPFDPLGAWSFPSTGPMSGANGALPWLVFERDREKFARLFPNLKIEQINYHTPFRYLLSGGLSYRALVPAFTYPFFRAVDNLLVSLTSSLSMFTTVVLIKT